ncbi:hypothetical protein L226DRAFT_479272 [Lentinus tigrinus ALCF2SS1-7]|uniref:GPI anchored protein n=1 Tax=Lentinus tigrinus ALCF2SS1-6 TaxID=1328759 RepID=A0A5C2STB1_9APHY|nr:hypothetical protein L227DRAFT_649238 [Lentinus tigrinus ALCF2SS1-6]RPD80463.1 hypothetical protein L226DRAFT_479272 [Lentinus tigrinus ALCF2SS1-7]
MRTFAMIAALAAVAAAETTLFIPGFDPQQITVDVEGVDASGHTTYRFGPGVTSGTFEDEPGIIGSATLVAGATDAHLVWNNPEAGISMSEDCGIANGIAVCTAVAAVDGVIQTVVATETASGFVVQGDAAAATNAPSGSGATPTAGSALTTGPSATSSASGASPTETGKDNGAGVMGSSMILSLGVAGVVSAFFL